MAPFQNGRSLASYLAVPNTLQARRFIVLGCMISLLLLVALRNQFSVIDGPYRQAHHSPPPPPRLHSSGGHPPPPPDHGSHKASPPPPAGKRPNPLTNPLDEVRQTPASIRQDPLCSFHPDTSNIAVVMKTGATESFLRMPTQFMTTLRCIPDYLVFSDRKETIAGIEIMDALENVLPKAMEGNPDFDLYRVQASCAIDQGPCTSALDRAEMGWSLDKYKNIHMAEKTWKMLPDKDWYLYIDADTYVVWNTLVPWLKRLDPNKKVYLGSVALLGDIAFAHGGSGYLMSRAAMKDLVEGHPGTANRYDEDMHKFCCGDAVFAKAVQETIDVNVTGVWPTINGEKPFTLPYGDSHWCHPIATMHHMSPEEISTFWEYETQFYADEAAEASRKDADKFVPSPILAKDIFGEFFASRLLPRRNDWDNLSDGRTYINMTDTRWSDDDREKAYADSRKKTPQEKIAHESFETCRAVCEANDRCFQFSFKAGSCRLDFSMKLGKPKPTKEDTKPEDRIYSGWMVSRITKWVSDHETCKLTYWPTV